MRARRVSPERTGFSHSSESRPGEPRLSVAPSRLSTSSRMYTAAVCQPLAISPAHTELFARSGSTWYTCGSKAVPKATMLSALSWWLPSSMVSPTGKSSK